MLYIIREGEFRLNWIEKKKMFLHFLKVSHFKNTQFKYYGDIRKIDKLQDLKMCRLVENNSRLFWPA